jgi:ABC-type multidrug transport system ATPase subunit
VTDMDSPEEAPLVVDVGTGSLRLAADDVHYLWRDGTGLAIRPTEADDDDPERQLGYFIRLLGRWFFHAANVPAARVLRIDGRPVLNVRQELASAGPVRVRLATDVATGPLRPRRPANLPDRPMAGPGRAERPARGTRRYSIGRAGTHADLEIDDPLVRARHATVRLDSQGRWWISGEVLVDGERKMSATLSEGDVFVIGQTAITVSADLLPGGGRIAGPGTDVRPSPPRARRRPSAETGLSVSLDHVTVYKNKKGEKRLDDVTLEISPMEVVAVVGPSGAGKSSLIDVLLGELPEDEGTVRIGPGPQTDPQRRRQQVRCVPQGDEGLFQLLTVRETLTYAAQLRAVPDTSGREIDERVDQVLDRLGLKDAVDDRLSKLSGGQRRRVSIGTELVGNPQLLLLDEPTSGLDPGKDRAIMEDLREIAASYHCTVVIVTHATEHLGFVDKIVTVGKGGRMRDAGPPDRVLASLDKPTWADLMVELDRTPPEPDTARPRPQPRPRPALPLRMDLKGLETLVRRQVVLITRRGRNSIAVLVLVPLLCTVLAIIASGTGLTPSGGMGAVLSILATVAALTGASLTYPDIVNDAAKLRREFRVGVEAYAMVLAKAVVYAGVCAVLAGLVTALFAWVRDLPPEAYGVAPILMLYLVVLLTTLASMSLGLLISAGAPSLERAVTWSTLLAVFQVALGGTLFHLKHGLGILTALLPARLGVAAIASYADFNAYRLPPLFRDSLWNQGAAHWWLLIFLLAGVTITAAGGAVYRLHRRFTVKRRTLSNG